MEKQLFRKASIDRVSSPEQLNDYVRVSNPSVWVILAAIIILLTGVCIWGIFGRLDTVVKAAAVCENGTLTLYITEADIASVKEGMSAAVNGGEYTLSAISQTPVSVDAELDEYIIHKGGFKSGDWVYTATAYAPISDGTYTAAVTVESVPPMSFVLN
ncbi:MAG: hypothetical protein NC395_06590 [Prevotella sp.]|nr:hypothetical protein [Prevotella sp.]